MEENALTTFTKLVGAMGEIQLTVNWANGHIGALAQLLVAHQEYSLALVTELLPRGVVVHVCILSQEQDPAYRSVVSMGEVYKMEHVTVEMGLPEIAAKVTSWEKEKRKAPLQTHTHTQAHLNFRSLFWAENLRNNFLFWIHVFRKIFWTQNGEQKRSKQPCLRQVNWEQLGHLFPKLNNFWASKN